MTRYVGLVFALLLWGCAPPEVTFQDLPVEYDQKEQKGQLSGKKELLAGIYEEQLFKPLTPGDKLHIIQGFQGGAWIHLSVRITGMPGAGKITVTLHDKITTISYDLKLLRSAEGFLEAYDIPVPIKEEGAALDALYGKKAQLEVTFTAESKAVVAKVDVVLHKG